MKATSAWNRRGTVHEWVPTAVRNYLQTKCSGQQEFYTDLQSSDHQLKGLPLCKRCFPQHPTDNY